MKLDDVVRKRIDRLNSLLAGLGRAEKVVFSTEDMVKWPAGALSYHTPTSSVFVQPRSRTFLQDFARYCA